MIKHSIGISQKILQNVTIKCIVDDIELENLLNYYMNNKKNNIIPSIVKC